MEIEFAIELMVWDVLVPAAISVAVLFLLKRFVAKRYCYVAAVATGLLAGYLLHDWSNLNATVDTAKTLEGSGGAKEAFLSAVRTVQSVLPQRHYQWIPWLPALLLLPLGLSLGEKIHRAERVAVFLLSGSIAAWLIVPSWSRLDEIRPVLLTAVAAATWIMCCVCDLLAERMSPRWFLFLMTGCIAVYAGIMMPFMSLRHGEIILCGAGALTGATLMTFRSNESSAARSLSPICAMLLVSGAFVSFIEPDPPNPIFLLPLAAPMGLLPFVIGPLRDRNSIKIRLVQLGLVIAILATTAAWLYASMDVSASEY